MAAPFIFISTTAVKQGKLEEYRRKWREFSPFIEQQEPRLLHFGNYLSEDGSESSTLQIHPDAASMEYHMTLIADHVRDAAEHLDFSRMSLQIFGAPTEALLEQMRQISGSGVPVSIKRLDVGFDRLPEPQPVAR